MRYFDLIGAVTESLKTEERSMEAAGHIIAETVSKGGVVVTFGSGHSNTVAMEIGLRAGGLVPVIVIQEPSGGQYEKIEGVGTEFFRKWDLRENDCVVIISNSGRNPLPIELAMKVKEMGIKLIVVTSLEFSKNVTSRHSSGKKLYEFADVILDNKCVTGDSALEIEGVKGNIGPTSTIAGCLLLNQSVTYAVEELVHKGIEPPVLISANVDAGRVHNEEMLQKYKDRLHINIVL